MLANRAIEPAYNIYEMYPGPLLVQLYQRHRKHATGSLDGAGWHL